MSRKQTNLRPERDGGSPSLPPQFHAAVGRGRKHRCAACGVAFYDLERPLSVCPKCATPYAAAPQMRSGEPARKRQSWSRSGRRIEPGVDAEPPAAAKEDDDGGVPLLDDKDDEAAEEKEQNEAAEDGNEDVSPERKDPDADRP